VADADHAPIVAGEPSDDLLRVIGAAVVDENDLVVDVQLAENGAQPLVHDRYGPVVIVTGHDGAHAVLGVEPEALRRLMVAILVR
jgi:hypothetical protein